MWGGEPQRFAPSALLDAWADLLPGFDATRHELSDIQVEIGDGAATAQARVRATHWLGDRMWVVAGSYEYALVRTDNGWQVIADDASPGRGKRPSRPRRRGCSQGRASQVIAEIYHPRPMACVVLRTSSRNAHP
ncbi:nuclear transport factor 2 family protein [Mesorhizobium sp. M1156]|uniref:nuclear transport factor 2 family protein n=1 Tax=Mesorhizobium sp. M1156 TaxID=2957064 RepID=UPI00333B606F